ncbi:MAG: triose-phosphate isomerase, partial [Actinobacteria bacterium]|nr:triose-phosphate isomerase [Actinomycetota bacterium]NIU66691.1 triose-phosphate isomerase [Actinomycetota bacterium]NIV87356.1 triose-phosphate isomerase [Actinomycetota bacterium]NIW28489.1 triose-phosphate isomerase [Actinomycetota bacterium]NIX20975.1 triose-phosphate isomerase [Actinomycetota bacterium]
TIVIFPPSISLTTFVSAAADRPDLRAGAQDVYWEREGAFTGAISATMAREAGAEFSLAGHSERRHV